MTTTSKTTMMKSKTMTIWKTTISRTEELDDDDDLEDDDDDDSTTTMT